jgi:hypothetical protein
VISTLGSKSVSVWWRGGTLLPTFLTTRQKGRITHPFRHGLDSPFPEASAAPLPGGRRDQTRRSCSRREHYGPMPRRESVERWSSTGWRASGRTGWQTSPSYLVSHPLPAAVRTPIGNLIDRPWRRPHPTPVPGPPDGSSGPAIGCRRT